MLAGSSALAEEASHVPGLWSVLNPKDNSCEDLDSCEIARGDRH